MLADIAGADPKLAARMHLALGGLYLDRLRVNEAIKELAAARATDPARPEVPLFQGLVHTQFTGDRSAATESLKAAHALSPNDPVRTYLLARHLIEIDQREAGVELLRQVQRSADQIASGGPTAPFIRLDLVREIPGIDPFLRRRRSADGCITSEGRPRAGHHATSRVVAPRPDDGQAGGDRSHAAAAQKRSVDEARDW
jgi:predicted Zn-dependent protease